MKQLIRKTKGVIKGMPTGILFSIIFHAVILMIAAIWGIAVAVKAPPLEPTKAVFVEQHKPRPPKRPKLKEPPKKPGGSTRIVTKSKVSAFDFQLPEVSGTGERGFGQGLKDSGPVIDININLDDLTLMGTKNSIAKGNEFEGTFYSMMRDRQGRSAPMSQVRYLSVVKQFLDNDWSPEVFLPFFQSPNKLYTTFFFVPRVTSERAPVYFGIDPLVIPPINWVVYYSGQFKSKTGGKFRFRGFGDDILLVRVNGKLVLNATQTWNNDKGKQLCPNWFVPEERAYHYLPTGGKTASPGCPPLGIWFDLKPDEPADMEVLMGETGGSFTAMLVIQEHGKDYPENPAGGPILPMFKTAETPESVLEEIKYLVADKKAELDDCPLFNVY